MSKLACYFIQDNCWFKVCLNLINICAVAFRCSSATYTSLILEEVYFMGSPYCDLLSEDQTHTLYSSRRNTIRHASRWRSPLTRCPWWWGGRPEGSLLDTWRNGEEAPPQKTLCQAWPRQYMLDTWEPRPSLWLAKRKNNNDDQLIWNNHFFLGIFFESFWLSLSFISTHSQLMSFIFPPTDSAGGHRKCSMSLHQKLWRDPCHWTQTERLHEHWLYLFRLCKIQGQEKLHLSRPSMFCVYILRSWPFLWSRLTK